MLIDLLAVVGGLVLLTFGADRFVEGAVALARNMGVSTLIIGLTIIGFATSAPEMLVAALSSWSDSPGLAVGNAIGSNITNIALVLGVTALIAPLAVESCILRREYPIMLFSMLLVLVLLWDGELSQSDGIVMSITMVGVILLLIRLSLNDRGGDPLEQDFKNELPEAMSSGRSVFLLIFGLLLLLAGSQSLVWGASNIARAMGVSDLVIGLTIVAIGTSLPELAASIVGVRKGESDLAIGNVIGSNMFNILAVMAMPALIRPGLVDSDVLARDYPIMMALTVLLLLVSMGFMGSARINRWEGGLLLSSFVAYQYMLFITV